jgi:hypothetical protein
MSCASLSTLQNPSADYKRTYQIHGWQTLLNVYKITQHDAWVSYFVIHMSACVRVCLVGIWSIWVQPNCQHPRTVMWERHFNCRVYILNEIWSWMINGMDFNVKTALNNILGYLRKLTNVVWKKLTFKNLTKKHSPLLNLSGWKRVRKSLDLSGRKVRNVLKLNQLSKICGLHISNHEVLHNVFW